MLRSTSLLLPTTLRSSFRIAEMSDRLVKLEEAVKNLAMSNKQHLKRIEDSFQKKISEVEQSVLSLQQGLKSKPPSSVILTQTVQTRKTIEFSFTVLGLCGAPFLESPEEEIGGAKWSLSDFFQCDAVNVSQLFAENS
uniref:Uncharacterized protein n=1 Tax=Ditylenchus dipsaci TaxID=166011 RepID=A0A915E6G1_9BILA